MEKLFSLAILVFFFTIIACESKSVSKYEQDPSNPAYLVICPRNILGCANKVSINTVDYLISSQNNEVQEKIEDLDKLRSEDFVKIPILELEYTTVKESGHFPNPMAEFDVIRINKISY